ncbi:MAG TPA: DsbA family protein [Caulobacteraceae bacterium]|jgi:protein-disulfide isomerase
MAPDRRIALVACAFAAALGLHAASSAAPASSSSGASKGAPAAGPAASSASTAKMSLAPEETMGNPKAKVTVIEYASASCPHCARMNNEVIPQIKKAYIDTGKVRYVFREFLTPPVPFAGTAFMMARCGGDKNYFALLDDVFHQQEAIFESGDLPGGLLKIGAKYGLDKDKINACMSDEAVKGLNDRVARADKDGVEGTPTFVIGDAKMVGEQSYEDLAAAIDKQLAK